MINRTYPIAIIEDRYCGTYSGGKWVAIARYGTDVEGDQGDLVSQRDGPWGSDPEAQDFWRKPPDWAAAGATPDAALAALMAKLGGS